MNQGMQEGLDTKTSRRRIAQVIDAEDLAAGLERARPGVIVWLAEPSLCPAELEVIDRAHRTGTIRDNVPAS